jgi:hypothetical protein
MLIRYEWRLEIRLRGSGAARWMPFSVRRAARKLVIQLSGAAPGEVMVVRDERNPTKVFVFGDSRPLIEATQKRLETLVGADMAAVVAMDRWSDGEKRWIQVHGSVDREERMGRHGLDDGEASFRVRVIGLTAAVLLAAGGIAVYVSTPYTFGAYQASTLGTVPLVLIVLIWLHRRLPTWM